MFTNYESPPWQKSLLRFNFCRRLLQTKILSKRRVLPTVQKLGLEEIGLKAMPALIAALKDDNV